MKKAIFLSIVCLLLAFVQSCKNPAEEQDGAIYGVVTDKATGEPIKTAGVELSPMGMKTVTGSEGQFEFSQLTPGQYTLLITKTGYQDYASSTIEVKPDATTKTDIQIEQLPPSLRVIDDNRNDISELDFGTNKDDLVRSFSIFNDGSETLEWEIVKTAPWIVSLNKTSGSLAAGSIQVIVVTIDRTIMSSGWNTTTLHITSNSGNKQLTAKAYGYPAAPVLKVVNAQGQEISELDFGSERDDLIRSFTILNDGTGSETLNWNITTTAPWISLNQTSGTLTAGQSQNIIVTIDRTQMNDGWNTTTMIISSNGGNKQLTVRAYGYPEAPRLKVVNGQGQEISTLNFGYAEDGSVQTFVITNDGNGSDNLNWNITSTASWVSVNQTNGSLPAGNSQTIIVTINRANLPAEENSTTLQITSNGGNKQLSILANSGSLPYVTLPNSNLMVMTTDLGAFDWTDASLMCENLSVGGFSDWRLPTLAELTILYTNRNIIGGFSSADYWSSTYYGHNNHYGNLFYYIDFSSGNSGYDYSTNSLYVRAVRSIQ